MIDNDAVILGLLAATLGVVFWTTRSPHPFWQGLYKYVPALVLCYFLPALYNTFGLIDGDADPLPDDQIKPWYHDPKLRKVEIENTLKGLFERVTGRKIDAQSSPLLKEAAALILQASEPRA